MQAIYHRAPKYAPKRQTVAPRRLNIRQSTDVYKHPASMTDPINIDSKDEILDQVPEVLVFFKSFLLNFLGTNDSNQQLRNDRRAKELPQRQI